MNLIIVRSCECVGNTKEIFPGVEDPLTQRGKTQANTLSLRFKDENISAIFSSPLIRARETAEIIYKNHPNSEFILSDELRAGDMGSCVNKKFGEVDWKNLPEGVESKTSLYNRSKSIIEKVKSDYSDKTVLFIAHGSINRALIRFLRKWDAEDERPIPQGNASINIFEVNDNYKELKFNDLGYPE